MKLAVPDLISPSYFPALAAAELGFFAREGLEVSAELIFPVDRAYEALRDGAIDFVGGANPALRKLLAKLQKDLASFRSALDGFGRG